ncbi:MAG: DUF4434 domain-containing protein [Phycisphaerae bacterium]
MKFSGTFLDEISVDIVSQNWGRQEWDEDFRTMKSIGIDTVILIRCGWRKWLTYPSLILMKREKCYKPPVDLVQLFLELSDKYGMDFYFGLYDSHKYWLDGQVNEELDLSLHVAEEAWSRYGKYKSFKGWYLPWEISRNSGEMTSVFHRTGRLCKDLSGGGKVLISPYIAGTKELPRHIEGNITAHQHEKEWNEIMAGIAGAVDIVAFQDGQIDFPLLPEFLQINKTLAEKHGLTCWTNTETFDRDLPATRFLPIRWEKLLLKLNAAAEAGVEKAITFEFSHFLSPHSAFPQAHGLFRRYCEHFQINPDI